MEQKINDLFTKWDEENFSGVISISNNGKTLYEKVAGYRNRGERLPNQPDTAFGIASGTKLFTAAAICQLIDQGKLTLGSKIHNILTLDLGNINKDVTILHLLTHSSGIADYLDFDDKEIETNFFDTHPVNNWISNEYYLPLFNQRPKAFELGEKMDYSNSNFILLGLVIEKISGMCYREHIKQNILIPLGMTRTGFHVTNNLPANTAIGYTWDKKAEEYVGNYFRLPVVGAADGGLYTTAHDMAIFWQGIFTEKLFSANMQKQFLLPRTFFEDIEGHMGLGVFVSEKNGQTIYWHDGGDSGVVFCTAYFPASGNVMTILLNVGVRLLDFQDDLMALLVTI